jgi:hypothetical protein
MPGSAVAVEVELAASAVIDESSCGLANEGALAGSAAACPVNLAGLG